MFDSTKELLDKIRLGESTFLEFKEVRFAGNRVSGPHRDSVADELAAFREQQRAACSCSASKTVRATSSASPLSGSTR